MSHRRSIDSEASDPLPGRRRMPLVRRAGLIAAFTVAAGVLASAQPAGAVVWGLPKAFPAQIGDREVRATAQIGDRMYVGGNFQWVGPKYQGSAGFADGVSGEFDGTFPDVAGTVEVVVPDGSGGWYLGGSFSSVGGVDRMNAAQVDASGAVTAFDPSPNRDVRAILPGPGGVVYLGGAFSLIKGQPVSNLAAVAALTGDPVPGWMGIADGPVATLALTHKGSRLLVGGTFANIGGRARANLASLDASTGAADPAFSADTDAGVDRLLLSGDGARLFVGGDFTVIDHVNRSLLASISPVTGAVNAFDPEPANGAVLALALSPDGSTLYLGGSFTEITQQVRYGLGAVDSKTGALQPLAFPQLRGFVATIAVTPDGTGLYMGGDFGFRNDTDPTIINLMASVDLTTGLERAQWQPPVFSGSGKIQINDIELAGPRVLVAGTFASYGGDQHPYLIAVDVSTGQLDAGFQPATNGPVYAIQPSGDGRSLFIGGTFSQVGGVKMMKLARIDAATGALFPGFANPFVSAQVNKLALFGNSLYAGGTFTSVGGKARDHLARVDAATGAVDAGFDVAVGDTVRSVGVTSDGSTLFVVGAFATVGGKPRWDVASIDTQAGAVTGWAPSTYESSGLGRDLAISPDGATVYVVTAGGDDYPGGDTVAAFPTTGSGDVQPRWVNRVGDTIEAVAATSDAVYIGGHFRWIDSDPTGPVPNGSSKARQKIAALNPVTGTGLAWDPSAGGFRGVLDLTIGPSGLLVGSDGWTMGRQPRARFGLFRSTALV